MSPKKKLPQKEVFRLARQKLIADISSAIERYEGYITEGKAPRWDVRKVVQSVNESAHKTDITTAEEIAAILPPEPPKRSRARKKSSPVGEHLRGEESVAKELPPEQEREPNWSALEYGLGKSEEKVLILIAQSNGGMTPAQIAIKVALKKRTIQNVLTSLKSSGFIFKDAKKFQITVVGRTAIKGRHVPLEKGAILAELSESERKVLFAIASKKEGITVSAISVMVPGIKKRTKQNILTALKTRELIEKLPGDRFALTEHAREELKDKLEKPLTGKALRDKLRESLPAPQAVVLDWLCCDGGRSATAEEIAIALDYAPRTVQNIFTALKAQELIQRGDDGRFEISEELWS